MADLFNTRLFRLAVSFMVVQNIDTYHDEAYLALLGAVFVFLLKQEKSEWKKEMLQKIYTSIKVTYGATKEFQDFILEVEKEPFTLFKAKNLEDHVDIVKVMLIVFYISQEKRLDADKIKHLADLALVHYAEKTYVENEFKIFKVAEVKLGSLDKKEGEDEDHKKMGEVSALFGEEELKKLVDKELGRYISETCINVELNDKIFLHEDDEKRVTFTQITKFFKFFNGRRLENG